jgi:hypothetical protein
MFVVVSHARHKLLRISVVPARNILQELLGNIAAQPDGKASVVHDHNVTALARYIGKAQVPIVRRLHYVEPATAHNAVAAL